MSTRRQSPPPTRNAPLSRFSRAIRTGVCGALAAAGLATAAPALTAAPASAAAAVTVTPNPWDASEPFEGWGTSLAWFANATGNYPAELRQKLYDLLFTGQGLDLTVARYNVGGGNASDVTDYLRPGGAVDGYWKADPDGSTGLYKDGAGANAATTVANKDNVLSSFDPSDDSYYDWSKDATQRWWLEKLEADKQLTHLEAFVNSAPYFMTNSGYVSGGFNSSSEQLNSAAVDKYVAYLTKVVDHLENQYGIKFDTVDPFNEPNTNYWGTSLTNGKPTGGRQEGMHVGPAMQQTVIKALQKALAADGVTTDALISAMDETNPGIFASNWSSLDSASRAAVGQMNTHTYGTSSRLAVRDQSKVADKPLWMSEVEGDWSDSSGFDPADIDNGIGMASHINGDLAELDPTSWVLWQPVEDLYNMDGTYSDSEDLNWGSVYIDFDCRYYDENNDGINQPSEFKSARRVAKNGGDSTKVEPCGIRVNSKFNVMRNYTNFIHPGDSLVPTNNTDTTAAVDAAGNATTVVYSNTGSAEKSVKVDLSKFGTIADGATATAYVTTQPGSADTVAAVESTGIVEQAPVAVDGSSSSVTIDVPAKSVTTIVVHGVSGVASAAGITDGDTYQVVGTQSAKALTDATGTTATTATTITTPATTAEQAKTQQWTFHAVALGTQTATKRYVLTAQDGDVLTATAAGTALKTMSRTDAKNDPSATWILNTTDGSTYSLVNQSITQALEVGGQSTTSGASVGVYGSNGGANQSWTIRTINATGSVDQTISTPVGTTPALPATATPTYAWGQGAPVPVTWNEPAATTWNKAGEVIVTGAATDVFGTTFTANVKVVVGSYTATDPTSVTVVRGTTLADVKAAAPATVNARIGSSSAAFPAQVTWDWTGLSDVDFAQSGVASVPGTVASNDPAAAAVNARLSVIVTDPAVVDNICTADTGIAVSATYTESGYPATNTCDGSTNTRWSNWVSSGRANDTLTYAFSKKYQVNSVTLTSFERAPLTAKVQYLVGDTWTDTSAAAVSDLSTTSPTTISFDPVVTSSVRVVLTFNSYGKVAEVQITGASAGPSPVASLAALRLDGTQIADFDAATTDYTALAGASRFPTVQAVATDQNADVKIVDATTEHPVTTITVTAPSGAQTTYHVTFDVDATAPEVTASLDPTTPDGDAGWYRTTPTLTVDANDDRDNDPAIEYQLPGGDWTAYSDSLQVPDLSGTVEIRATDAAGNVSEVKEMALKVDTVAPSVGYTVARRTLILTALDANSTSIVYAIDGGENQQYHGPIALGTARSVTFQATDAAGNASAETTLDVTKDTAQVNLTVDRSTTSYGGTPVKATVSVSGKDLSGGVVSLLDGGTVLAKAPVGSGRVVLTAPATLTVGTHRLTAMFSPSTDAATVGAISVAKTVRVVKASSRTSVSVKQIKAKRGPRITVTVRSTTSAAVTGTVKVTVRKGAKKVGSATAVLHHGQVSVRVPHRKLRSGKYRITVTYTGSGVLSGSAQTKTVRVR